MQIVGIGLRGGFVPPSPGWESHVRAGETARRFGTTERAVRGEDEEDGGGHVHWEASQVLTELKKLEMASRPVEKVKGEGKDE